MAASQPQQAAPIINDGYWFAWSGKAVDGALAARNDAAAKLQTLVVWLWGIYTASAAVGFALAKYSYPFWTALVVATPSWLLILAYCLAAWVQIPILAGFDPRVPKEIEAVYDREVRSKQLRLRLAVGTSMIAAAFVGTALMVAALGKGPAPGTLRVRYLLGSPGLAIASCELPVDTAAVLRLTSLQKGSRGLPIEFGCLVPRSGLCQWATHITSPVDAVEANLRWRDADQVEHSLTVISAPAVAKTTGIEGERGRKPTVLP